MREFKAKLSRVSAAFNQVVTAIETLEKAWEDLQGERTTAGIDRRVEICEQSVERLHEDFAKIIHLVNGKKIKESPEAERKEAGTS